jgi:hypothetical protein
MGETKRSQQMQRVLEEFGASGQSRQEFCRQRGIPLTTLDYWRREHSGKAERQARPPRLVKVEVARAEPAPQFTLGLANGRRIECSWRFVDAELARLIRIAESA